MKKWLIAFGCMVVLAAAFVFYNKLYYPSLPITTITKKEVVEKLNDADEKIIPLTREHEKEWYIVNEQNQSMVDETIIEMLSQTDWVFKRKDGSGLFFEKQGDDLLVTTQKWTENYSLVDIPTKFDE